MVAGQLTQEVLEERLLEARKTYKLNMGYAGLNQLPAGFVELVKKYNPHITELELSSNNLTDLPDELEEFRYLRILRLKYNQLKKIPAVVFRLPQLMVLELSGNAITKVDEAIGQSSLLKEFDISGNSVMQLPDSICNLSKLEILQVENNRLEILPENIGELVSLVKLDISTNSLRFLPASMGNFKKVQRIDCANNLLAKVPPSMGHLKTLKEFNLRYNSLDERYKAKVEEGLSRLLAFLRDEEERERLEEIERLKPIGTPVGAFLEYKCKSEVGQVVKSDAGDLTLDNRCWIRTGHTLTQVGSRLLVFGGQLLKDGTTTADLFWMTTERMEWHNQPCKGDKPCARYNHSAVWDEENNRLVVFGGRTAERKRLNDVYYLDLDSWTWFKANTEGTLPSPREQAAVTFWAGNMVLFGGHAIGGRANDLFLLDLSTWQWTQPATAGTAPSPRQAAAVCIGHGNLLFVHGGRNNFVLEDLHVLDFMSKNWVEVSCLGRLPPPRHSHLLTMHKDHLYLFGGLDELGAQSYAMYRIHMPLGENFASARPEWREWDSELPYNKCRTVTFFRGSLSIYQLGSNTLGRVNDEDAEKGLVFWDVFKTARLDALKARELDEDELKPKNAKRMRVQHTVNIAGKMPKSFNTHSLGEQKVLAYVADYQRIFEELYPHRRPLFLQPKNECGVPKLVCTTLRPSQLSYTELYDVDGAAQFVADFVAYEQLEDPLHPPEYLPSPMSVLNWQAGDSFDLSIVLASLLLGAGYNAYVVVGYAPLAVTQNDQTRTECPVLEREKRAASNVESAASKMEPRVTTAAGARRAEAAAAAVPKPPKYIVKPPPSLTSKVAKEGLNRSTPEPHGGSPRSTISPEPDAQIGEAAASALAIEPTGMLDEPYQDEPGPCKRVHAWVLVLPGKRDITEACFIEPSTGRRYGLKESPYLGVEFLWNDCNFWVCMQMPEPHSDSRAHPADVSFELTDPAKWEALLDERAARLWMEMNGDDYDGPRLAGESSFRGAKPRTPSMMPRTPNAAERPGSVFNTTHRRAMSTAQAGELSSLTPPRTAASAYAESAADSHFGDMDDGSNDVIPDMPPSWVPKLTIPRDAFDMKCPRGSKLCLYQRCQHEIFALFGDCSRWDGMVEKLILYADVDRTVVVEVREKFNRRKDKLRERRSYPQKDTTIENFEPGSSFGLKDILTVKNEKRIINFFNSARLDGLIRREEYQGKKMIETFVGRDDRLVYRSATYAPDTGAGGDTDYSLPDDDEASRRARRVKAKEAKKVLPVRKMTEKFARNDAVDADTDVAKRVYHLMENRIQVEYHFGPERITNSCRTFHKDGQSQIVQVNPLAPRPQPAALLEEYQQLLMAEKECMQAVRDSEWEVSEILRTRTNQEQNITLDMPYYDIMRIKAEESEEEEEEAVASAYDYLSPFLPTLLGGTHLSREQALEVREKCLKALKDRLIERANIIQARLDEESAALAKRQQNFYRDRDQMSNAEEEEYERAVEESMFRIHILEKRLKRHEEQALAKYYELDHKLRNDSRLSALINGY